jgi:hypothetical protein
MPWTQMTQGFAAKTCCPDEDVYTEAWAWMTSYYSPAYAHLNIDLVLASQARTIFSFEHGSG